MIQQVIVLGGGSAGILAALTSKKKLPELSVMLIRSRENGIIGVGEGTPVALPRLLHGYLEFDPGEFSRKVETNWRWNLDLYRN